MTQLRYIAETKNGMIPTKNIIEKLGREPILQKNKRQSSWFNHINRIEPLKLVKDC